MIDLKRSGIKIEGMALLLYTCTCIYIVQQFINVCMEKAWDYIRAFWSIGNSILFSLSRHLAVFRRMHLLPHMDLQWTTPTKDHLTVTWPSTETHMNRTQQRTTNLPVHTQFTASLTCIHNTCTVHRLSLTQGHAYNHTLKCIYTAHAGGWL